MLAELSDQICEEHQLSVIREPENQTVTYDKWLGENAKASQRDMLRMTIDAALRMQPDIDAHKEAQAVYSAAGGTGFPSESHDRKLFLHYKKFHSILRLTRKKYAMSFVN